AVRVAPAAAAASQLRALAAERLAGALVTAAAELERGSLAHHVLLGRGQGGGHAGPAGKCAVPVESAGPVHARVAGRRLSSAAAGARVTTPAAVRPASAAHRTYAGRPKGSGNSRGPGRRPAARACRAGRRWPR